MKIIDKRIDNFIMKYPLERLCALHEALFLDIETTGFTARSSFLYLIGCAYYDGVNWHTIQWMAENPSEQKEILDAFFDFAKDRRFLIQFNGNQFDIPYLTQKCAQLELSYTFEGFDGADLFRRLFPYKSFLSLMNLKQKTIETFLSLDREDVFTGGELVAFYQDYIKHPTQETLNVLLLHNEEDLKGMLEIMPMLSYFDAFHYPLTAKRVQANTYRDANGNRKMELMIHAGLPSPVPVSVTRSTDGYYAKLLGEELLLRVPVYEEEMKYFYSNYKDYYYLPEEDCALHRSVASFVDKAHREPATARNCYTRKFSAYLQEWDTSFTPFFKRDYDSPELFFELTDELKQDRNAFAAYASLVLRHIAKP